MLEPRVVHEFSFHLNIQSLLSHRRSIANHHLFCQEQTASPYKPLSAPVLTSRQDAEMTATQNGEGRDLQPTRVSTMPASGQHEGEDALGTRVDIDTATSSANNTRSPARTEAVTTEGKGGASVTHQEATSASGPHIDSQPTRDSTATAAVHFSEAPSQQDDTLHEVATASLPESAGQLDGSRSTIGQTDAQASPQATQPA